jgi:hypothetical protein
LKVNYENSRIRIHKSEAWIPGSGFTVKCHESGTLLKRSYICGKERNVAVVAGAKKASDPGSGSATMIQYFLKRKICFKMLQEYLFLQAALPMSI